MALPGERADVHDGLHIVARRRSAAQVERQMTGDQIKRIREALGLSQSKFATWLGASLSALQDWEEGRRPPTNRAIRLLQKAEASAIKLKDRLGK